jgi:hypothetical protein
MNPGTSAVRKVRTVQLKPAAAKLRRGPKRSAQVPAGIINAV